MIFYFTGTGNSLFVAKTIEGNPISIPQVINKTEQVYKDNKIGIVAPIYGHEMPEMVKNFIKSAKFQTDYFYIILTYGNRHGGAVELTNNFCKECSVDVDYLNLIQMVDNWLPSFDMKNCQTCMACIHNCPKKAIQLNIPEKNPKARYRNDKVTLQEIIEANKQIQQIR